LDKLDTPKDTQQDDKQLDGKQVPLDVDGSITSLINIYEQMIPYLCVEPIFKQLQYSTKEFELEPYEKSLYELKSKMLVTTRVLMTHRKYYQSLSHWEKTQDTNDPQAIIESFLQLEKIKHLIQTQSFNMSKFDRTKALEDPSFSGFLDAYEKLYQQLDDFNISQEYIDDLTALVNLFKVDFNGKRSGNYRNWDKMCQVIEAINNQVVSEKFQPIKEALEANEAKFLEEAAKKIKIQKAIQEAMDKTKKKIKSH
jgi:hypothetical protein